MKTFMALLIFFASATLALAEEQLTPRTFSTIHSYLELSDIKSGIWTAYTERKSAAYDTRRQAEQTAFDEYEERRLKALDSLSKADWENYSQWLDAKERRDYDRQLGLERTVSALQEYLESYTQFDAVYRQAVKAAKLRYDAAEVAAEHVRKVEELNADAAFQPKDD